jgi:uncharacterized protein
MDTEISHPPLSPNEPPLPIRAPRSPLNTVFHNDSGGLRAGWRLVMYIVMILIFSEAINLVLAKLIHLQKTSTPAPWQFSLQETLSFAIVFLPACLMAWFEHRPVGEYGLPLHSLFGVRFWQGMGLGIAEITILMACIAAFHGYSFGSLDLHGATLWKWATFWLLFFVVVGLFEEFAFRGYLQFTLADGIGFWPAAWILSLSFGALHLGNPGEGWVGAISVAMIGLIFALTLKRTGNLWFVVGWHAAFDFGETYLFSVPNSGNVFQGHLSNATLHGAKWLTGGTVGPEGSIFSFITMAAAALFIHVMFPPRKPAEARPATATAPAITPQ